MLPKQRAIKNIEPQAQPHRMINGNACFAYFNKSWGIRLSYAHIDYRPTWSFTLFSRYQPQSHGMS